MTSYEQITVEDRDEIRLITLNRPDKLNAWTPTMSAELVDAFESGNSDSSIGAFVVTGAGRGFCAGADVSEVFKSQIDGDDGTGDDANAEGADSGSPTPEPAPPRRTDWVSLMRSSKPVVAAINGASIGVGLTLVLSMIFSLPIPTPSCRRAS